MKKARKKKGMALLILFLLMAVLLFAYFLLVKYNKEKDAIENEDTGIMLSLVPADDIVRIDYGNEKGTLTLEKKEDKWFNKKSNKEVEQADIHSMLNEIAEIKALQLVTENPEDISDYGLLNPVIKINAALKDGGSVSIDIGNEVPEGGGYYASLTGEEKVYVVPESLYQRFSEILE